MLCERCGKKKATIFYRENVNGKVRAFHLCGECASTMQETGELEELSSAFARFSPSPINEENGFFAELFSLPADRLTNGDEKAAASAAPKCPLCGATFGDILSGGRVGCASCYRTFAEELASSLHAVHGQNIHAGQVPHHYRLRQERARYLDELRRQLKDAIQTENFEEAATLRDRIRATETEGAHE